MVGHFTVLFPGRYVHFQEF